MSGRAQRAVPGSRPRAWSVALLAAWLTVPAAGQAASASASGADPGRAALETLAGGPERAALTELVARHRAALFAADYDVLRQTLDPGAVIDAALALAPHPRGRDRFRRWQWSSELLQRLVDEVQGAPPVHRVRWIGREPGAPVYEVVLGWLDGLEQWQTTTLRVVGEGRRLRIVDARNEDLGIALSQELAADLAMELDPRLASLEAHSRRLQEELVAGRLEPAAALLSGPLAGLPEALRLPAEVRLCWSAAELGRWAWALERLSDLQARFPRAGVLWLLQAQAESGLGRPEAALASLAAYDAAIHGPDAFTLLQRGFFELERGDEQAARACFEGCLDRHADELEALLQLAALLPRWELEPLGERFRALSRPDEDFELLVSSMLELDLIDAAEALCEFRLEDAPDDPDARYWRARLHLLLEQFDQALREAREALPLAPAHELEAFQSLFLEASLASGAADDPDAATLAYALCPDRRGAFRVLAETFLGWGDAAALESLLERHRAADPADPWIGLFEALEALAAGDEERSLRELSAGWRAAEDETLRERYRASLIELAYERGEGATAWLDVGPAEDSFAQLVELAFLDGRVALLKELGAVHRARVPDDPLDVFYRALADLRGGDHPRALRRLERARAAVEADGRHVFLLDRALVTARLAVGDGEGALADASQSMERDGDAYLPAAVLVRRGAVAPALELLQRCVRQGYDPWDLYDDELIGDVLLADPAFEDWRAEFPPFVPEDAPSEDASDDGG